MTKKPVNFDDYPVTLEIKAEKDTSLSPFDEDQTEEFTNVTSQLSESLTNLAQMERKVFKEFKQTNYRIPAEVSMLQSAHAIRLQELRPYTMVNATIGSYGPGQRLLASRTYFMVVQRNTDLVQIWDSRESLAKEGPLELILSWKEVEPGAAYIGHSTKQMEIRRGHLEKGWHAILPYSMDEQKNVHGARPVWMDLKHTYHSPKKK